MPAPGQRASGTFTFAGDEGLSRYTWPYFAISGRSAGPKILVTAGIHAAEYTGTLAAIRLGRKFIGIERDHDYFSIACRRIEQAYAQRPLFEPEPQRVPEQMGIEAA